MIRGKTALQINANPAIKRKADDDGFSALEENIKRFRITHTPGELRLGKDIKALVHSPNVQFEFVEDPASVQVTFTDHSFNSIVPNRFLIKVSKYYPHHSPIVFCLDKEFTGPFIGADGEIQHEYLQNGWSALGSISTVIDIIQSLRPHFLVSPTGYLNQTPLKRDIFKSQSAAHIQSPDSLNMEI